MKVEAAEQRGWYLQGSLGAGPAESADVTGLDIRLHADFGAPYASLSGGRAFQSGLRIALEGSQRINDVEILESPSLGNSTVSGSSDKISARSYFLNTLYDFDLNSNFSPFLGLGIGRARMEYSLSDAQSQSIIVDDSDRVVAWQAIAGLGVTLSKSWAVSADYRYWRASDLRLDRIAEVRNKTSHTSHSVWLSLTYFLDRNDKHEYRPREVAPVRLGSYFALSAGGGFAQDADLESSQANLDAYRVGPAVSFALGKPGSDRFRWEIEGSYRSNKSYIIDFGRLSGEELARGQVRASSLMVNALYGFRRSSRLQSYVGMGAGVSRVDFDVSVKDSGQTFLRDRQTETSFQLILGASARLTDRVSLTTEYRYWFAPWLSLTDPEGTSLDTHHNVHTVLLGLHFRFGQ